MKAVRVAARAIGTGFMFVAALFAAVVGLAVVLAVICWTVVLSEDEKDRKAKQSEGEPK